MLKEEYDLAKLQPKFDLEDNVRALRGIGNILGYWIHYNSIHLSGENQQRFSLNIITNYRNSIKEYMDEIHDSDIKERVAQELVLLFKLKRQDLDGINSVILQIIPKLKSLYQECKIALSQYNEEK